MAREYYSIPEAAVMLGVSRIAVFKRVKAGRLPAIRFGRNWAVPASALPAQPLSPSPAPGALPEASKPVPGMPESNEMDSMGWD